MTERGILFSAPMVHAIQAGRKSQTRRVAKPRGRNSLLADQGTPDAWTDGYILDPGNAEWLARDAPAAAGDFLYVREEWRVGAKNDETRAGALEPRTMTVMFGAGGSIANTDHGWGEDPSWPPQGQLPDWAGRRRPGMHMPRWASRMALECVGVRLERLNDCTEADALAEGIIETVVEELPGTMVPHFTFLPGGDEFTSALAAYRGLWGWINGPDAWAANPLVWQICFERRDADERGGHNGPEVRPPDGGGREP